MDIGVIVPVYLGVALHDFINLQGYLPQGIFVAIAKLAA